MKNSRKILKIAFFALFLIFFSNFSDLEAQSGGFFRFSQSLKLGSRGNDVLELQRFLNSDPDTRVATYGAGSPGQETDFFGNLTKKAVILYQNKYKKDVLAPIGLSYGTGFVGSMTIKKMNEQLGLKNKPSSVKMIEKEEKTEKKDTIATKKETSVVSKPAETPKPTIYSVSPEWVKRGDLVTVSGKGFAKEGNTIVIADGPLSKRFYDLSSADGKKITFTFEPPVVQTMSEEEIRALPWNVAEQIEEPLKKAGKTLADALSPYKDFNNEDELRESMQKNGHSFEEIYNYFFVGVETSGDILLSERPLFHGLRDLPISQSVVEAKPKVGDVSISYTKPLRKIYDWFFPTANAQVGEQWGGGLNTGIIMVCTCGDGYLTVITDYSGGSSGLWWFSWGFKADAGAGLIPPNWLGGFQRQATCSMYAGLSCFNINANQPTNPWGTNLL